MEIKLDYKEIGRNIRHCGKSCKLKQKDLAEKVNVTEQHISHIENGSTKLSLPTLVAIANALSVDCNTLLGATLVNSQEKLMKNELGEIVGHMDAKRLRFCLEFCRLLMSFESYPSE